MKVFLNTASGAILLIDNNFAVIEPKPVAGTVKDQIKNGKRRIADQSTGMFDHDPELSEQANHFQKPADKEIDPQTPETPEPPENPNNSQET